MNYLQALALKTLGNGVFTTYGYDAADRLEKLTNALPSGAALSFFNYTYDERGRIATFDYGLWDSTVNMPAGRARETSFAVVGSSLRVGARVLRGWLDLARLPGLLAR